MPAFRKCPRITHWRLQSWCKQRRAHMGGLGPYVLQSSWLWKASGPRSARLAPAQRISSASHKLLGWPTALGVGRFLCASSGQSHTQVGQDAFRQSNTLTQSLMTFRARSSPTQAMHAIAKGKPLELVRPSDLWKAVETGPSDVVG